MTRYTSKFHIFFYKNNFIIGQSLKYYFNKFIERDFYFKILK